MTTSVLGDNLQAYANCEPEQWNEGVFVANAVHVVVAGLPYQRSSGLGTAKKALQHNRFQMPGGFYFLRRPSTCSAWIWSNVRANEPFTEPAKSYLLNWRVRPALQRSGELR